VPAAFIAVGPNIKKNVRLMGFPSSVFDIAPTILHIYGIQAPRQMRGRVLVNIFQDAAKLRYVSKASSAK
jgi:arylsulfatase A-like enzyme